MKIGFYGESLADQEALAVFAEGILGEAPEPIGMDLRAHGVTDVLRSLENVFRGVYYGSDAEGLVVVVDCDDSELHDPSHDVSGGENCRLCAIKRNISRTRKTLKARPGRPELKVAVGLAVPAIEAWYLVGKNRAVGEAAWKVGLADGRPPFIRSALKKLVYTTDRPSIELETARAVEEARRLLTHISAIESAFPAGFGLMAQEIRSWAPRMMPLAAKAEKVNDSESSTGAGGR